LCMLLNKFKILLKNLQDLGIYPEKLFYLCWKKRWSQ
jgi:hypothetical protein